MKMLISGISFSFTYVVFLLDVQFVPNILSMALNIYMIRLLANLAQTRSRMTASSSGEKKKQRKGNTRYLP